LKLEKELNKPVQEKKKPKKPRKQAHGRKKEKKKVIKSTIVSYILLCLAILASILVRVHYASIPALDDWAKESAEASLKPQIMETVDKEYFGYSEAEKQAIVEQKLEEAFAQYKSSIDKKAQSLKESYKDPDGQGYRGKRGIIRFLIGWILN